MSFASRRLYGFALLIVLAGGPRFRGGKIGVRDRWYGLEGKQDFHDFKRWWHREGKDAAGGRDLADLPAAQEAYLGWIKQGRPTAK